MSVLNEQLWEKYFYMAQIVMIPSYRDDSGACNADPKDS